MRFQTERCIQCNTPKRVVVLPDNGVITSSGRVLGTEFWICSEECLTASIFEFVPKEFHHDTGEAPDHKRFIENVNRTYPYLHQWRPRNEEIDSYLARFAEGQDAAISKAVVQFGARLFQESKLITEKRFQEETAQLDKEIREAEKRREKEALREAKRLEEEAERMARELAAMPPAPITFDQIPDEQRYSGHWIVAPPGRGKSVLLSHMFLRDLQRNASIIVMDSKGDLSGPIKELRSIKDRLVLIELDASRPLALNPFDIPRAGPQHTGALLEYMISGLLGAKLTDLQLGLFRNIIPIIIRAIPRPTINVFKTFLIDGFKNYQEHFGKLDARQQRFMTDRENGFLSETYKGTRNQVIWRIDYLLSNDIIRTMLESETTRFDVGKLMDEGKVIVIDNSKDKLTEDGCEFIGRFFIYLILAAARQRSGRPRNQKLPCFFYIDECYDVIRKDENIADIIDQCRSQNVGLILAHQRMQQIVSPNVLDALMNCGVRFANSDDDAKALAHTLRTQPEYLQSMPVGTFAAFVRDLTRTAAPISVPYVDLSALPKLSPQELQEIRRSMHAQYGFTPHVDVVPPEPVQPTPAPVSSPKHPPPTTNAPPPPMQSTPTAPTRKRRW